MVAKRQSGDRDGEQPAKKTRKRTAPARSRKPKPWEWAAAEQARCRTGLWRYQLATNAMQWSPEALWILGLGNIRPGRELVEFLARVDPAQQLPLRECLRDGCAGGVAVDAKLRYRRDADTWLHLRLVGDPETGEDPARPCLRGTLENETELVTALSAGHETRELLDHMESISEVGTWWTSLDGMEYRWSKGMCRIWGFPVDNATPSADAIVARIHPDDRLPVMQAWEAAAREALPMDIEYRLVMDDKSIRPVQSRARVERDSHGRPLRLVGTVADLTRRRAIEEQRLASERELRERQRLESLGLLAGGAAHDFNNLLSAVLGNLELAFMDLDETEDVAAYLMNAESACRRMGDLATQMLAYAGRTEHADDVVDLNDLIVAHLDLLRLPVAGKGELVFECEADGPPLRVRADPSHLRQLVMNLVLNGAEALEDRGSRVLVRTRIVRPSESLPEDVEEPHGELVVSDDGVGMDPETLARIFDPFFTTKKQGHGIGLATVHGIIRQIGATMTVDSTPGHGTTFRIQLPLVRDEGVTPSVPGHLPPPKPLRLSGHVLVADDEESVRTLCCRIIERTGARVTMAVDGKAALEAFGASGPFDLVLLDLSMPRIDGIRVLSTLNALQPSLPVVVMSGFSEQAIERRIPRGQASGVLPKPFSARALLDILQRLLPQRAAEG